MATTSASVFIDTNVLVYANIASAPFHQQALDAIYRLWDADVDLWISRQVLREYMATVTRPQRFMQPIPTEQTVIRVAYFQSLFRIADDTVDVTAELLQLVQTYPTGGKQIHDANIVATMRVYGIDTVLTQNVDDFKRFVPRIQLIPLMPPQTEEQAP
jgi:predicted nucleic acid-binding protein